MDINNDLFMKLQLSLKHLEFEFISMTKFKLFFLTEQMQVLAGPIL